MTLKRIFVLLVSISFFQIYSQEEEKVLFTIDDNPVYVSEFLRVYNKNLNIVADENQKDIKNYLDLFVNYKLKIKQAYDQGYDTIKSYKSEFNTYKEQLIEPYLKDDSVVEGLVNEAYQRGLQEVNASHILIKTNSKNPADTLNTYNKILEARQKIVDGEDFIAVAKKYSQDPSVTRNGGDLGYFSVFNMVYPFENAAYTTKVGEVSKPFLSKFGYHILQVHDKRDAKGEVEAAHIMIKSDSLDSETKANEIYTKLMNGEDFGYLAKTQSDDAFSAKKNGSLGKFGSGRMIKEFEDVAFSLKDTGNISKPFKTKFGWHIIKLLNKFPLKSFDELKGDLSERIKRGDRSKIINSSIINKLKKEYKIVVNDKTVNDFKSENWKENSNSFSNEVMTINGEVVSQEGLTKFIGQRRLTDKLFTSFKDKMILDYYKSHLSETNSEYANTLQEYKEGLLLFEILQARIWDKSKDSVGVQKYYDDNKSNYMLGKRFEGSIATSVDKKIAKNVKKGLLSNISNDSIKSLMNPSTKEINVIFKSGEFKENDETLPKNIKLLKGVSKIYKDQESYLVVKIDKVLPNKQQELDQVRGSVINDYQELLEKQWIDELRLKYKVKLDDKVLKTLIN